MGISRYVRFRITLYLPHHESVFRDFWFLASTSLTPELVSKIEQEVRSCLNSRNFFIALKYRHKNVELLVL